MLLSCQTLQEKDQWGGGEGVTQLIPTLVSCGWMAKEEHIEGLNCGMGEGIGEIVK